MTPSAKCANTGMTRLIRRLGKISDKAARELLAVLGKCSRCGVEVCESLLWIERVGISRKSI